MVVNKKYFSGFLVLALILTSIGVFYYKNKQNYLAKVSQTENLAQKEEQLKKSLLASYLSRQDFLRSLTKDNISGDSKKLQGHLDLTQAALQRSNIDFTEIDSTHAALNQFLAEQVIQFRSTKKLSTIFKNENQVKNLERFDRQVDLARMKYSDWSFQYWSQKESIEKTYWGQQDRTHLKMVFKDVPYFSVDHLIRKN